LRSQSCTTPMARPCDGGDRVLYVDPDATAAETVAAGFEEVVVEVVSTAEDANRRLVDELVDCVIAEHDLPESDGLDLLTSVRENYPTLPAVLFVADGDETLASDALSVGLDEYVVKRPLDEGVERLVETVTELLDRRRAGRRGSVTVDDVADGDVPTALKERAMDEAPVGITIADARREDMPLIYVNEAFERLTGYDRSAALGRNCRFLQGPATASEPVDRFRAAIGAGEPASEELVNYRKDGRAFWNRVDLAPVYDGDGLAYYVGFQTDITDRKRAESAARRRAEALEAERRSLERLLDRLDGLVLDVTRTLVQVTGREALVRRVCERMGDADSYDFAWIGERDVASERIRPTACSTGDAQFVGGLDVEFGTETPIAAAVADCELRVVEDSAEYPGGRLHGGDWPDRFRSMAAVPLAYRETVHGVLCVYASDPGAFDAHERAVLTALGRMIGTAINAQETEERLATDAAEELEFGVQRSDLLLVSLADELDCRLEFAGSARTGAGSLLAFVDATGADPDRLRDAAAERANVAATIVTETDDGCLAELELDEPFVVEALAECGVETRSLVAEPGNARLIVDVPRTEAAREVADRVRDRVPGADLLAYRERERPAQTRREFVAELERRLTDRQQSALRRAYLSDYFERPRPVSGDELAASMGVSRSTFHQHLRAAEHKLVEAFFEELTGDDEDAAVTTV